VFSARPVRAFLLTLTTIWLVTLGLVTQVPTTYESQAVVAFKPRDANVAGAETMVLVTPKYVELLRSPAVIETAARQLGQSVEDIRDASTGVIEPNTLNLRVEAKGGDPARAAEVANVLAAGVIAAAARDPLLSAEMVAWAVPATAATPPGPFQVLVLGMLIGLFAATMLGLASLRRTWAWRSLFSEPKPRV
jgi:capsular polysaccharide biosynthesis protein